MTIRLKIYVEIAQIELNYLLEYNEYIYENIPHITLVMIIESKYYYILLFLLFPLMGFGINADPDLMLERMETYSKKMKADSATVALHLDSAKVALENYDYKNAIDLAEKSFELSKKFPNSDFSVQSVLILARSFRDIHLQKNTQSAFSNTLKYYMKAITALESSESSWMLPNIYKEYGDFYAKLNLTELTIENYVKALNLIIDNDNYTLQKEIITKIAALNYDLGNLETAIHYYNLLYNIHNNLYEEDGKIAVLVLLSDLYREIKDYDNAIFASKEILNFYQRVQDEPNQISLLSNLGEISYEAGDSYQADKAFKSYFSLVKSNEKYLKEEVASLRYIWNLITEGDIYSWSMDNGYWSDYKTAVRYYNDAQKYTDFQLYPDLASTLLNRIGSMYFNNSDYKTCVTYFDLALYYAVKNNNLDFISTNHIMLARAYDGLEKWEKATEHYELHATYKDSIILNAEKERIAMEEMSMDTEKENLKVEQILNMIEDQERQEFTSAEKELRNVALESELELYRQDAALKEMLIQNQKLGEDSAKRNLLLATEQFENERNAKKIEKLNFDRKNQELLLQNQEADQQIKNQRIKILEQENSLASSKHAYYMLSIIFISLILFFISVVYVQKRKANIKLRGQNEKIEQQSEKLKQAYQNLELLSTIGRDITSSLIIEEIIETVYENLNRLMDASVLGIGVYDHIKNNLHFPGVRERHMRLKDIYIDLSADKSLAASCFNNQHEIILDNYFESYANFIQPEILPVPGDGNSTSIIYIPLTIGDKKLGVLTVQSFDANAFNEYKINIIRNIGIYAKIALENASVYRKLEIQSIRLKRANTSIGEQNKLIEEQYQELVSINQEKNNLINILAHDLRNPLATAMSMTELVRYEKENLSAEQYQANEIIWRGLNRMDDMIRKILDIKAVESQKINLDFEILNTNEMIRPLERLFAVEAERKSIKMHFSSESEEPLIKADRNYLVQVMENLISNALKFSPSKRNVFIHVYDTEEFVRISVKDEGPGIPEIECVDLFKKYHKLSPKPTAGEQSIGLGLSIAKKYVEAMKGKIWYESEVGSGAEFIVQFQKESIPVA